LDPQNSVFLKKIQLNAALQLAAEGKPFDNYKPMQDYKDIIAATDEKEQGQWTKKVVSILQIDMMRAAKAGEFSKAADFADQAYQLEKQPLHQHHKDFYQVAHLFQQKQYSQADRLSSQLLADRKSMNEELLSGLISLKLNVTAAGLEAKEIKPDMDKLWDDYQEWSTLQSKNPDAKVENSSQKQIILFLLRKTAQEEAHGGRFDKAQLQCQRMLTIQPKDSEIMQQQRIYEYQIHLEGKDFSKLLEKCHTELAFNSKDRVALKYEGLVYLHKQKLRDSMHSFEKLSTINNQEPEPLIYLSEIASAMQNFDKAQSYLRRAISLTQAKQKQFSTEHPEEKENSYTKQLAELNKFEQSIQDRRSQIIHSSMGDASGKIIGHCISLTLWTTKPLSSRLFVQRPHSYPTTYTP
jgi:tetratricopeptide (TPR) repeat protein